MKAWVARDYEGYLGLYSEKPSCIGNAFWSIGQMGTSMRLVGTNFPEVTFDNSPQEVEIKLILANPRRTCKNTRKL
jgi:hypothetical protein